MRINKNNLQEYLVLSLLTLFVYLTYYKSIQTEITIDEAYSFLNYAYVNDVFNIGLANNHILNSLLVSYIKHFSYSEFALRIPNLFFGFIYYFTLFIFYKKNKKSLVPIVILISNPYIFDFFSISRGYGICASLIFLAVNIYIEKKENFFILPFFLISISTLSYHVSIVFLIVFVLINYNFFLTNKKKISTYLILLIFLIVTIINAYILLLVTSEGKPLYGIEKISLFELFIGSFGMNSLYLNQNIFFQFLLNLFFIIPIFCFKLFPPKLKKLFIISYFSLILIYLFPIILNKPIPLLREIVPFLPPILFLISKSLMILLENKSRNYKFIVILILIIFLIPNFINSIELNKTIDWKDGMSKKDILKKNNCAYVIPFNELDSVGQYYRLIYSEEVNHDC